MEKVLFLTLNTFSATGGIEKVCRAAGKALYEICAEKGGEFTAYSMYDKKSGASEAYFPSSVFRAFDGKKLQFVLEAIRKGRATDVVILSHINLLVAGWLIKMVSPKTRLILLAHGIEVWDPIHGLKKKMIQWVDLFLPVSAFTGQKLQQVLNIPAGKILVLNNCLDPFIEKISAPENGAALRAKYGFSQDDFVLLTLTRLKFSEQYKGYDKVVKSLGSLKDTHPQIKYVIAGKYDAGEKARLDIIIAETGVKDKVVFTGFINEEDVAAHFNLANLYIMPSTGEGFGIVFIEALFYGKPVIAGNRDGSIDALAGGKFGLLVNPDSREALVEAIVKVYKNEPQYTPAHQDVLAHFTFDIYKTKLRVLLQSLFTSVPALKAVTKSPQVSNYS